MFAPCYHSRWDPSLSQALESLKSEQGGRLWEGLLRDAGKVEDMAALDRRLASEQQGAPSSSTSQQQQQHRQLLELAQDAVSLMLCILACHTVVLDPSPEEGAKQQQKQQKQQADNAEPQGEATTHSNRHHKRNGHLHEKHGSSSSMDKAPSASGNNGTEVSAASGADVSDASTAPPPDRPPNYQVSEVPLTRHIYMHHHTELL
jgi:hypothetical protein